MGVTCLGLQWHRDSLGMKLSGKGRFAEAIGPHRLPHARSGPSATSLWPQLGVRISAYRAVLSTVDSFVCREACSACH